MGARHPQLWSCLVFWGVTASQDTTGLTGDQWFIEFHLLWIPCPSPDQGLRPGTDLQVNLESLFINFKSRSELLHSGLNQDSTDSKHLLSGMEHRRWSGVGYYWRVSLHKDFGEISFKSSLSSLSLNFKVNFDLKKNLMSLAFSGTA